MRKAACIVVLSLLAAPAYAEPQRVAVGTVSGSISFMVESAIRSALRKRKELEIVSPAEVSAARGKVGQGAVELGTELGLAVIVEADAERQGASWTAEIRVVGGADGRVLDTWTAKAKEIKKLSTAIERNLWKKVGAAIKRAKAPPRVASAAKPKAPEPEEEEEPKADAPKPWEKAQAEPPPPASAAAPAPEASASAEVAPAPRGARDRNQVPLEVLLGFDLFARSFRYNDDLFGLLRPYTLSGAPSGSLRVVWFPAGHFTRGFATHIGLDVAVEYAFGIESSDSSNAKYPTSSMEVVGALVGRLPLGSAHELTLSAGGGIHRFAIEAGDGASDPDLPDVGYGFLRAGAGARFELIDDLAVRLSIGYRQITSAGDIQSDGWFPRSSAGGLDGTFSIGYAILDSLEVMAGVSGRHYFYTMNPEPGDPRVAGGAVDQYFGGTLALSWTLGR